MQAFDGPYQKHVIVQNICNRVNERISENNGEWGTGRAYIRMGELGHVTWLSVKIAIKSPDPNEHGGGHML